MVGLAVLQQELMAMVLHPRPLPTTGHHGAPLTSNGYWWRLWIMLDDNGNQRTSETSYNINIHHGLGDTLHSIDVLLRVATIEWHRVICLYGTYHDGTLEIQGFLVRRIMILSIPWRTKSMQEKEELALQYYSLSDVWLRGWCNTNAAPLPGPRNIYVI